MLLILYYLIIYITIFIFSEFRFIALMKGIVCVAFAFRFNFKIEYHAFEYIISFYSGIKANTTYFGLIHSVFSLEIVFSPCYNAY